VSINEKYEPQRFIFFILISLWSLHLPCLAAFGTTHRFTREAFFLIESLFAFREDKSFFAILANDGFVGHSILLDK
jgi:hypothetical protein